MRTFFAVTPDPDTQLSIERWFNLNWPTLSKPVPAQNYHITLAFLGTISSQQLERIEDVLSDYKPPVMTVSLNDVGYWPDSGILWLGPPTLPTALNTVAEHCARTANRAGIRVRKKTWQPHLTLARNVQIPPSAPLTTPDFSLQIDRLLLLQSLMERTGVRYLPVREWRI